jgi:outer membrane protein assembly factor BamD
MIYLLLTTGFLLVSGCATINSAIDDIFIENKGMEKNADQLVSEGSAAFMAGNYKEAVKAYTDLRDWYPFSKYTILAELKIADAHFELKEYTDAIFSYEEFEKLHPRNDAIPYVVYRKALSWFNQIDTVDRDHTPANKSLSQFARLMDQYPDSPYAEDAEEKIEKCIGSIANHELYVANYYLKAKKYKAALKRYEYLVEHFIGTKHGEEALNRIPKCIELINKK